MSDIDVVRRERGSAWLWLLLLAGIALVSWVAWTLIDDDPAEVAGVPPAEPTAPIAAPLPAVPVAPTAVVVVDPVRVSEAMRAYTAHVGREVPADGQHLYAAAGISRLATALAAIVGREPGPDREVVAKANAFFLIANLLVVSPDTLRLHADWMHRTALAAVDAMEQVGETRFPGAAGLRAELEETRRAAEAIRPEEGLMGQRDEVRAFFRQAADPLRILAERSSAAARDA